MTPLAVSATDCFTSSSTVTIDTKCAQVSYLGVFSRRVAEEPYGDPEDAIDYDGAAASLLVAGDVEEADSPVVNSSSPFGF